MDIDLEFRKGILFVRMNGELDHHSADGLREKLSPMLDEYGIKFMVLNFSHVSFMDSSGLGVILGRYNQISAKGGKVIVCGLNKYLRNLFEMSGLFQIVDEATDELDAIQLMGV